VLEKWSGIAGYDIKTLTESSRFPLQPDFRNYTDNFEEPENWDDSYGSRIRGFFVPDQTGNHVFFICKLVLFSLLLRK